jgi:PBP1b-binding outer membrane lipoprotein LpoB
MRKIACAAALALVSVLAVGCSSTAEGPESASTSSSASTSAVTWPSLPTTGFVTGRAAAPEDVESGSAGFLMQADGNVIGVPIDIIVPQYAWHKDQETGTRTPGIIIQAEAARGQELAAMRTNSGEMLVAFLWEFELLGTVRPAR